MQFSFVKPVIAFSKWNLLKEARAPEEELTLSSEAAL